VFFAKIVFWFFMIAMAKAIVPRYRYDQLMRLGWKVFLPTSLVLVMLVAAWRVFGPAGLMNRIPRHNRPRAWSGLAARPTARLGQVVLFAGARRGELRRASPGRRQVQGRRRQDQAKQDGGDPFQLSNYTCVIPKGENDAGLRSGSE
jgi:hypothetical protein